MSAGSGLHCKRGGLFLGCVIGCILEHVPSNVLAIRRKLILVLRIVFAREFAYNQHATRVRRVPHFVHECAEGEHKGTNYETSKILD